MATRRYTGNLHRYITAADLQGGRLAVADPWKVDSELQGIFTAVSLGDPTISGANGNNTGSHQVVTTPSTAGKEFAVKHGLSVAPKGVFSVCPLVASGGTVRVRFSRAADSTYAYLTCPDAVDVSITTSLYFLSPG